MAANLEHTTATPIGILTNPLVLVRDWCIRASRSLQSAVCGLGGHESVLQIEHGRIFLRCTNCGHESPGWTGPDRTPRLRFPGDASRHRLN
ncbi:MAG TPA: hypothetical protein VIL25_05595 [Vicinamibacterales bacterium]